MTRHVTVIGGGIVGLASAWELLSRGYRVTLIEADRIGAGSSGGTVGALAPHAPENWHAKKQVQLDALIDAQTWWSSVVATGGVDPGYARTGRIQPLAPEALDRARDRVAAAADIWPRPFAMELTDAPSGPLVPDSPSGLWLTDTLTARVAPRRACAALGAAIRAAGGEIIEGAGPQHPGNLSGPAVWATGVEGLLTLETDLGRPVGGGVKGQSALLRFDAPDAPQVFADGLHIVPHGDGTIAIGSTSERDTADLGTDHQLDALIEKARVLCPVLRNAPIIERWAGIRPRALSRAPLIGHWPGRKGHVVANGGFKIGFALAPAIAAMAVDLLEGRDRIPGGFGMDA